MSNKRKLPDPERRLLVKPGWRPRGMLRTAAWPEVRTA